ncbi:MAG: hypothetical protein ACRDDW_01775 [Candidatus Rhabdochlamydia sp.]
MALPTNYFVQQQMNDSINPFSATNMINRNLMDQAVKEQRHTAEKLFERTLGDDNENHIGHSEYYINAKKHLYSNFKNKRQRTNVAVTPNSEHGTLSSRSVKVTPNVKGSPRIRHALLYWFCMQ